MKISIFGILTIIFTIAKLMGYINWSWWIVLSPILIPVSLVFLIPAAMIIAVIIWFVFEEMFLRKNKRF